MPRFSLIRRERFFRFQRNVRIPRNGNRYVWYDCLFCRNIHSCIRIKLMNIRNNFTGNIIEFPRIIFIAFIIADCFGGKFFDMSPRFILRYCNSIMPCRFIPNVLTCCNSYRYLRFRCCGFLLRHSIHCCICIELIIVRDNLTGCVIQLPCIIFIMSSIIYLTVCQQLNSFPFCTGLLIKGMVCCFGHSMFIPCNSDSDLCNRWCSSLLRYGIHGYISIELITVRYNRTGTIIQLPCIMFKTGFVCNESLGMFFCISPCFGFINFKRTNLRFKRNIGIPCNSYGYLCNGYLLRFYKHRCVRHKAVRIGQRLSGSIVKFPPGIFITVGICNLLFNTSFNIAPL